MSHPEFTCSVVVQHLPEHTDARAQHYAFSYTVRIRNSGDVTAQLVARHWIITDGQGHVEEVRGLAVVGQQPLLKPGEEFEYTSWTRIGTPSGSMHGSFLCVSDEARPFDAPVPEFGLTLPSALH